jgi:hypothetical protein
MRLKPWTETLWLSLISIERRRVITQAERVKSEVALLQTVAEAGSLVMVGHRQEVYHGPQHHRGYKQQGEKVMKLPVAFWVELCSS